MSGKGRVLAWLGGWMLTDARVAAVDAPHARYRRIVLEGEGLAAGAWRPGDKVQLLLPEQDVRTYTPIAWEAGRTTLLAFLHGEGPGARWAQAVHAGDRVRFVGPQRSLRLDGVELLAGDETAIAVAAGLGRDARVVIRAADVDGARAAAEAVGVRADAHGTDAGAVAAFGRPAVAAVAGGSAWIVAARAALREAGAEVRVKAYWAPGRTGLD